MSGGRVLKYQDLFALKYNFVKRIITLLFRKVADVVSQPVKAYAACKDRMCVQLIPRCCISLVLIVP